MKIHGRLFPEQTRLKAGEYEFTPGMSTLDMISMMVAGATKHWQIQFIEAGHSVICAVLCKPANVSRK